MSAANQSALVPLSEDLQRKVEAVQHLRKALHDAYIAESTESTGRASTGPPPAVDVHRTLDAPTLALLKAPNYPFLLCEGAPPSYVPPPVPYDVEGEVSNMKSKVLQVQRDLVVFREKQRRSHDAAPASKNSEKVKEALRNELVEFLDGHECFSALAWQVSSLQWFYRWVLSHSISHLWNAKDQLEFVLTEDDQPLPDSAEAMDAALEVYPFTEAVALLDNDRQSVIALERRRLHSVSRTFRDRLPPAAITAATSCYLSSEEKYMYQEFYNQSEHLLLLLDHTMLMERSASMSSSNRRRASPASHTSRISAMRDGDPADTTALVQQPPATAGEVSDIEGLTQEALAAYNAEYDVIRTLIDTIRERRREGVQFAVSNDEYKRSRTAQLAVYGCVVSDMNLMAQQMTVAKEFLEKYEDWIRLHGFDTHDGLMQLLVERSGGSRWPLLSTPGAGTCDGGSGGHSCFTPPTAVWAQSQPNRDDASAPNAGGARQPLASPGSSTPRTAPASSGANDGGKPLNGAAAPGSRDNKRPLTGANGGAPRSDVKTTRSGSFSRTPGGIAEVYFTLLRHVDEQLASRPCRDDSEGDSTPRLGRLWMAVAMRQTVLRLAQSQWTASSMLTSLDEIEEQLLISLRQRATYEALTGNACALLVMVKELLTLSRKTMSTVSAGLTEVRVALHNSSTGDDLKQEVDFALSPVESERWGAVLDSLWFQADPSGAANGGLLSCVEHASANLAAPHFLRMEKVTIPVVPPFTSAASSTTRSVPVMSLFYRTEPAAVQTASSTLPATTIAAALLRDTASASSKGHRGVVVAQCARRYRYARAALAALYAVESKGLLPCYGCRIGECNDAPLDTALFLSMPQSSDTMSVLVGLLPPGATQLLRIFNRTELKRTPVSATATPFDVYTKEEINFSSIGMMVSALLSRIGTSSRPILKDLVMMAESTLEQANWECKSHVVPKSFAKATTHPTAMSCAAAKGRAISIQRETSMPNRNSISLRRFISPLLRHMDDYLATADFAQMAAEEEGEGERRPNGHDGPIPSPAASVTTRKTDMYGGQSKGSPSPSAVRPRGH